MGNTGTLFLLVNRDFIIQRTGWSYNAVKLLSSLIRGDLHFLGSYKTLIPFPSNSELDTRCYCHLPASNTTVTLADNEIVSDRILQISRLGLDLSHSFKVTLLTLAQAHKAQYELPLIVIHSIH